MSQKYWQDSSYHSPMVDHYVFRLHGRILKPYYQLPKPGTSLLDFGCGEGSAVKYFCDKGYDAYGVDISAKSIDSAKKFNPDIADRFSVCSVEPAQNPAYGSCEKYDVITSFQTLYYLSKNNFEKTVDNIFEMLNSGGLFFATMMSVDSPQFYGNSVPTDDEWLRRVEFDNKRYSVKDYKMFFVDNEKDVVNRFNKFIPEHVGHYSAKFTADEGGTFHYTFCGRKP